MLRLLLLPGLRFELALLLELTLLSPPLELLLEPPLSLAVPLPLQLLLRLATLTPPLGETLRLLLSLSFFTLEERLRKAEPLLLVLLVLPARSAAAGCSVSMLLLRLLRKQTSLSALLALLPGCELLPSRGAEKFLLRLLLLLPPLGERVFLLDLSLAALGLWLACEGILLGLLLTKGATLWFSGVKDRGVGLLPLRLPLSSAIATPSALLCEAAGL